MDLNKSGKMLRDLRKAKGLTQKQVAEKLGITPKAISKWETGNGFPDVSVIASLAEVLEVSEGVILTGDITQNREEKGDMKRTKFYVCTKCGSFLNGIGNCEIVCCGQKIEALKAEKADEEHMVHIEETDNEYYITFNHPMEKEHYISFVSYVRFDRVVTVKLYPEQSGEVRLPYMRGGKLYMYCNKHGLFEVK